jgi:hypothetical protein
MKTQNNYNEPKFKELVLYISRRCEQDRAFGSVKLNKLLLFADFYAYAVTGKSITGAEYMKLERGPAPRYMSAVREEMEKAGDLVVIHREHFGYTQTRTIARREPDLSEFSGPEIAFVNRALEEFADENATDLSELSHKLPGWQMAALKETIPYETIFISPLPTSAEDEQWALEMASRHGW